MSQAQSDPPQRLSPVAVQRVRAAVADAGSAADPRRIGPYLLLDVLGTGGMGVVYRAEQEHPIRRTVALKLIKPGMDSREIIRRLEQERQALAMMSHRSVAKVLDAGTSDDGRPYFVMEHVPGQPITRFCDDHRLTIKQRLALFIQACEAVQHAHQKAIIHRDLKPSNILVTGENGDAEVKVIDFGVAKALSQPLTERTSMTEFGQLIGTPEYMSPEQTGGGDAHGVDTRSDIYSLGVVLYELLTGALPFDPKTLRGSGVAEIQRIIREVDPPRPSTRFSALGNTAHAIARDRSVHVHELTRQLSGELEWIPLKAMRKEPEHRYDRAGALADDIRNYLAQRPLVAGPESRTYRLRKLLRRRRTEAVAAALVAVALLAGFVGTTTFALREFRQRMLAERRALETNRVAEFQAQMLREVDVRLMGTRLRQDVLGEAEANWHRARLSARDVAARRAELDALLDGVNFTNAAVRSLDQNILDGSYRAIQARFGDQPLVQARLLQQLAVIARNLTLLERATTAQTQALAIYQRELSADHLETIQCLHSMGLLLAAKGKWNEGESCARQVLERSQRALGEDDRLAHSARKLLAEALQRQGRLFEAEPHRRKVLEGFRRALGEDDRETIDAVLKLGQVLLWQDRLAEAATHIEQAARDAQRVFGEDDPQTLKTIGILGSLRLAQGRLSEAEALYHQAHQGLRETLGDDDRETLFWLLRIGSVLRVQGRLAEAEPYLAQAAEGFHRALGQATATRCAPSWTWACCAAPKADRMRQKPTSAKRSKATARSEAKEPRI